MGIKSKFTSRTGQGLSEEFVSSNWDEIQEVIGSIDELKDIPLQTDGFREEAEKWANEEFGVAVDSEGNYSAKHYATEASAVLDQLGDEVDVAAAYAAEAAQAKIDTQTLKDDVQGIVDGVQDSIDAANTAADNAQDVVDNIGGLVEEAQKWASEESNVVVADGEYSAKHYALAAQAHSISADTTASNVITNTTALVEEAEDARDMAELWASANRNLQVENGKYSAKHYAETAANTFANGQSSIDASITLASLWASADVDVVVQAGEYSAKHYATKASDSATAASGIAATVSSDKAEIQGIRNQTQTIRNEAEDARDLAEAYRDESKGYADQLGLAVRSQGNDEYLSSQGYFDPANTSSFPVPPELGKVYVWFASTDGNIGATGFVAGDMLVYVPDANDPQVVPGSYVRIGGEIAVGGGSGNTQFDNDVILNTANKIRFNDHEGTIVSYDGQLKLGDSNYNTDLVGNNVTINGKKILLDENTTVVSNFNFTGRLSVDGNEVYHAGNLPSLNTLDVYSKGQVDTLIDNNKGMSEAQADAKYVRGGNTNSFNDTIFHRPNDLNSYVRIATHSLNGAGISAATGGDLFEFKVQDGRRFIRAGGTEVMNFDPDGVTVNGDLKVGLDRVYHDGFHPKAVAAEKWANERTITLNGDVSGSVTIDGSSNAVLATTIDSSFATTAYVDTQVANAAAGGTVDLSNYYTKAEVYPKTSVYTKAETSSQIATSLSTAGFITQDDADIRYATPNDIPDAPDLSVYDTSTQVDTKISDAITDLGNPIDEAPIDGKAYLRQDGGWVEYTEPTGGSGGGSSEVQLGTKLGWEIGSIDDLLALDGNGYIRVGGNIIYIDDATYPLIITGEVNLGDYLLYMGTGKGKPMVIKGHPSIYRPTLTSTKQGYPCQANSIGFIAENLTITGWGLVEARVPEVHISNCSFGHDGGEIVYRGTYVYVNDCDFIANRRNTVVKAAGSTISIMVNRIHGRITNDGAYALVSLEEAKPENLKMVVIESIFSVSVTGNLLKMGPQTYESGVITLKNSRFERYNGNDVILSDTTIADAEARGLVISNVVGLEDTKTKQLKAELGITP